jgi:hypothetical protein
LKRQFSSSTTSPEADFESAVNPVADHAHRPAKFFGHDIGHRLERVFLGIHALFRASEVRGHHDFGARLEAELDGRHRCRDAGIGGDLAILDRDIEVGANEDALSCQVEIGKTLETGHVSVPCRPSAVLSPPRA